jgi:hypothetical protein
MVNAFILLYTYIHKVMVHVHICHSRLLMAQVGIQFSAFLAIIGLEESRNQNNIKCKNYPYIK